MEGGIDPLLELAELKLAAGVISKSEFLHIATIHGVRKRVEVVGRERDEEY